MIAPESQANIGYLSRDEQRDIGAANVVIIGTGGGGGPAAEGITRMGFGALGGSITVTDPETFEERNTNRQTACTQETIGMNKAEAVGLHLRSIRSDIDIRINQEGITRDNIENLFDGADIIIDESAYELHHLSVMVARQARAQKIRVVSGYDVGFGGYVTTYRPEGPIFEEKQLGLKRSMSLEQIEESKVAISRWTPYIPPYGDYSMFQKVSSGEMSAPTVAPSAVITAGLIATEAMLNVLDGRNHRPDPVYFNKALLFDPMARSSRIIKFNRLSHYMYGARMVTRNKLGVNPHTSD